METTRLRIRPFTPADAGDLYDYLSREQVVRCEPYPPFTLAQAAEEALRRAGDLNFHAVVLKETDRVIGNLTFTPGDFDTWELGYVFHDDSWARDMLQKLAVHCWQKPLTAGKSDALSLCAIRKISLRGSFWNASACAGKGI